MLYSSLGFNKLLPFQYLQIKITFRKRLQLPRDLPWISILCKSLKDIALEIFMNIYRGSSSLVISCFCCKDKNNILPVAKHFNLPCHKANDIGCVLLKFSFNSRETRRRSDLKFIFKISSNIERLIKDLDLLSDTNFHRETSNQ